MDFKDVGQFLRDFGLPVFLLLGLLYTIYHLVYLVGSWARPWVENWFLKHFEIMDDFRCSLRTKDIHSQANSTSWVEGTYALEALAKSMAEYTGKPEVEVTVRTHTQAIRSEMERARIAAISEREESTSRQTKLQNDSRFPPIPPR